MNLYWLDSKVEGKVLSSVSVNTELRSLAEIWLEKNKI